MRETPDWLYERLPYVYVLGGVIAASGFQVTANMILGSLLVMAGLAVFRLRIHHRLKATRRISSRLAALR